MVPTNRQLLVAFALAAAIGTALGVWQSHEDSAESNAVAHARMPDPRLFEQTAAVPDAPAP